LGRPYTLHTDASGSAVGATLGQLDEAAVEQPLAFASQKLSGPQTAWAKIEREAYAVIWALNRFRYIVYGTKVTVYCDHNALLYVRECAPKSAKLLRWALTLQEFDLEFRYIKGSSNVVAAWLSRAVCGGSSSYVCMITTFRFLTVNVVCICSCGNCILCLLY